MADQYEYTNSIDEGLYEPKTEETRAAKPKHEGFYQPKTEETRAAYKTLFSIIQQQLGDKKSSIIVPGVADEILVILKHDIVKNSDKKKEIEAILNPIPNHIFDEIVSIGNLITDFDMPCNSGPFSRLFGMLEKYDNFAQNRIMLWARDFGIEAEMEKLPPLPHNFPRSLWRSVLCIQIERLDLMLRNLICIDHAMDAKKIEENLKQLPPLV